MRIPVSTLASGDTLALLVKKLPAKKIQNLRRSLESHALNGEGTAGQKSVTLKRIVLQNDGQSPQLRAVVTARDCESLLELFASTMSSDDACNLDALLFRTLIQTGSGDSSGEDIQFALPATLPTQSAKDITGSLDGASPDFVKTLKLDLVNLLVGAPQKRPSNPALRGDLIADSEGYGLVLDGSSAHTLVRECLHALPKSQLAKVDTALTGLMMAHV
jgi:hypothetical protein